MYRQLGIVLAAALATACLRPPPYEPPTVVVAPHYSAVSDSASYAGSDSAPATVASSTSGLATEAPDSVRAASPAPMADLERSRPAMGDASGFGSARALTPAREGVARVSSKPLDSPFWMELGDSTLVALVREALKENPDVRVAQSRLRSARASRKL
ncbi:MAG TPA: hypothetical protein VFR95_11625, partial [Gemmatimonadaceae bacterium]|nr:hypothetical protein [Gemmatimonadaceae bacterium]